MAALQYVANAYLQTFTLASLYTAASGTMAVTTGQGARLPSSGDFWIRQRTGVSDATLNILKVTARTTDTLAVTGGQDGTTDQNILAGVEMMWALSVSALTQLIADIRALPIFAIVSKSSAYPAAAADCVILVSGNTTITLPTAAGITGKVYVVKKTDAAGTTVAIATTSSQTIDGAAAPLNITVQNQAFTVISDGSNWQII